MSSRRGFGHCSAGPPLQSHTETRRVQKLMKPLLVGLLFSALGYLGVKSVAGLRGHSLLTGKSEPARNTIPSAPRLPLLRWPLARRDHRHFAKRLS